MRPANLLPADDLTAALPRGVERIGSLLIVVISKAAAHRDDSRRIINAQSPSAQINRMHTVVSNLAVSPVPEKVPVVMDEVVAKWAHQAPALATGCSPAKRAARLSFRDQWTVGRRSTTLWQVARRQFRRCESHLLPRGTAVRFVAGFQLGRRATNFPQPRSSARLHQAFGSKAFRRRRVCQLRKRESSPRRANDWGLHIRGRRLSGLRALCESPSCLGVVGRHSMRRRRYPSRLRAHRDHRRTRIQRL